MIYRLRGADEGFSGLGAIAVPVYENCDPSDSACVARNNVMNASYNLALEQAANAEHLAQCLNLGYPAATCHAQFDPGGIVDSTANAGQPVQGYSILQAQTQGNEPQVTSGPSPYIPPVSSPAPISAPVNAPAGSGTPVAGASTGSAAGASSSSTVIGGFDLSSVPWYIWVGGAVAAFLAFGGGRGR